MFPTYYALNRIPKPSATGFEAAPGNTNQSPASGSLDSWLKGYDATKKNAWSAMINLRSAYVRPTFTPSDIPADPVPSISLVSPSNSAAPNPAPGYSTLFAQPSSKVTDSKAVSTQIIFPPPIPPRIPISPPIIPLAPSPVQPRTYPEDWCCASTLSFPQVQISISRLCSEIDWDWFDDNIPVLQPDMVKVPIESTAQDTTRTPWEILSEIYQTYCKWRATGVDTMHIFTSTNPDRRSLELWRAVVHEMIRAFGPSGSGNEETMVEFTIALVKGSETEGGKVLIYCWTKQDWADATGDILKFINQKCLESRLQYPGGTGRTEERIRTYSFYVRLLREEA
jgi:hypothetical protein